MADKIAEYSLQFQVEGSKATIKAMEDILKKMEEMNKQNGLQVKKISEDNKAIKEQTELFSKEEKQIDKTSSALWKFSKRLLTIGAVIGIVRKAWNLGVNFAAEGQNIKFMSGASNINPRDFQKWSYVAKKYGGNEGSIASAMQNIDMQIENAKYGQVPMQEIAARYGVTLPSGGTAQDFLKVIAKKMESMDRRSQLAMGRAFGLDEATIRMLQLGLEGLTKELANAESKVAFNNAQIERADAFNKKLTETKALMHKLGIQLGEQMLPVINAVLNLTQQLVNYVSSNLNTWKGNIESFFAPLINLIKAISESKLVVSILESIGHFISIIFGVIEKFLSILGDPNNKFFNMLGEYLFDILSKSPKELAKGEWNAIKKTSGYYYNKALNGADAVEKARKYIYGMEGAIINAASGGLTDTATSIIQQENNITIDGSKSPAETGQAVVQAEQEYAEQGFAQAGNAFATNEAGG